MKHFLISIFAMSFLVVNLTAQPQSNDKVKRDFPTYQIGDKVQDFNLPNTDGEMISLSNYKDANGYIIVFTSNVCPYAVANEERLIQLHNEMAPKGYPVIAINSNVGDEENIESMQAKVKDEKIPFAYLKDSKSLFQKFGATKTPHVFLLDKNMTVQYMGSIDDSPRNPESVKEHYLADAVGELRNNRTPNPAITKSIGCPIKSGGKGGRKGAGKGKGRKGPPSPEALLERMDENKDNKISKAEAKGPLAEDFDNLDVDKDGELSVTELSKAKPRKRKRH